MSVQGKWLILLALLFISLIPVNAPAAQDPDKLWEYGQQAYQEGQYDQALRYYNNALSVYRSAGNEDGAASTLYSIANVHEALGSFDKALSAYNESLGIYRGLRSVPDTAAVLMNIGVLYYSSLRRSSQSLPYLEESLRMFRSINEEEFTALLSFHLGTVYTNLGRYDEAIPLLEESIRLNGKLDIQEGVATGRHNLGRAYAGQGRHDRAISLYEEALKLDRRLGRTVDTVQDLISLGYAHSDQRKYDKALKFYDEALLMAKKNSLEGKTAIILNDLGTVYTQLSRYDKALSHYMESLETNRRLGFQDHVATSLNNIGDVYSAMGEYEKALVYYKDSLKLNRELNRPFETAGNLHNIGMFYYNTGAHEAALKYLNDALSLKKKLDNPIDIARTLDSIGAVYLFQKRYMDAERAFLERDALQPRIKGIRLNYSGLIETYILSGQLDRAFAYLKKMPLPQGQRDSYRIDYHGQWGRAYLGMGMYKEASSEFLKSVNIIEDVRKTAVVKGGFLAGGTAGGRFRVYRSLTSALAERAMRGENAYAEFSAYGKDLASSAFYFSESAKARTLLEAIASGKSGGGAQLPAGVKKEEAAILSALAEADANWEAAYRQGEGALERLASKKERLKADLASFASRLRAEYPLYAALNYPVPAAPPDIGLKDGEVLIEYALGESSAYVFVVRKKGIEKIIRIPEGREAIEEKVRSFANALGQKEFSVSGSKNLYGLLLAEALAGVKDNERVIIVPDGMLGVLPFESLVVSVGNDYKDSVYTGDKWVMTYAQSATVLSLTRMLKSTQAKNMLFALGNPVYSMDDPRYSGYSAKGAHDWNEGKKFAFRGVSLQPKAGAEDTGEWEEFVFPPLPETEDEVREIARLFETNTEAPDVLLNLKANETWLRSSPFGSYRYLHFATHADLPGKLQSIKEPFLLLGQVENKGTDDGFLTLSEVLDLGLDADMVVLSACVTGKGKLTEGEGVGSFARAFMHAGSRSVVVSLWEVASVEAVDFMKTFYGHLKDGKGRGEAMALARRQTKAKYPHPFYWSVFIMHGEG